MVKTRAILFSHFKNFLGVRLSMTKHNKFSTKTKTEKKKQLTLAQKYEILRLLDNNAKAAVIARDKQITPSVITRIKADREKIISAVGERPNSVVKIKSSYYKAIDDKLLQWFKTLRGKNVPISTLVLIEKADEIAKQEKIEGFTCNASWIDRFRKRNNIVFSTISGESKSVDMSTVDGWIENVWPNIKKEFSDRNIFNCDETALFYRMLPNKTATFKGIKVHGEKISKERLTIFLCTSMEGEKRPPIIIGKFLKPRCFKNKNLSQFRYFANKKAWMSSAIFKEIMIDWDVELKKQNRNILLLLDNCSAHPDISMFLSNIKLHWLPPNTTSLLQPLDAGIIQNFKIHYKKGLVQEYIRHIDLNIKFDVTVYDAIINVYDAWERVTTCTIKNCFNHAITKKSKDNKNPTHLHENLPDEAINSMATYFETNGALKQYLNIEDTIETSGSCEDDGISCTDNGLTHAETDKEESTVPEKEEIRIEQAIDAVKILKNYYFYGDKNDHHYNNLQRILDDLQQAYYDKKKVQSTIHHFINKK